MKLRTKEEIKEELEELESRKKDLEEQHEDAEEQYNDLLNDCYPMVKIGYIEIEPAEALRKCDEVAYNTGFSEWADNEITNIDDEIDYLKEELELLENEEA